MVCSSIECLLLNYTFITKTLKNNLKYFLESEFGRGEYIYIMANSKKLVKIILKGYSYKNVCEIIALNDRLDLN
jgi:hypothetical protein